MDDNTKASNFTLKVDYPTADVAATLRRKREKLADNKMGEKIVDQLPEEKDDNNP